MASPAPTSSSPGPSRTHLALWLVGILVAVLVPRMVTLRGVEAVAPLRYVDMYHHLYNADLAFRRATDPAQLRDPFLVAHSALVEPMHQGRWPDGIYDLAKHLVAAFGLLSVWTTQLVNGLFMVVLLAGCVGLGWLVEGPRTGLLAGLLVALCPALFADSLYFSNSFPLVAMTTVGLALLWLTRGFSDPLASLGYAAWSAAGLYVNLTYGLYLAPPTLGVLAYGLRHHRRARACGGAALGLVALIGLSLVLLDVDPGPTARSLLEHFRQAPTEANFQHQMLEPWTGAWLVSLPEFMARSFPWPLLLVALPGLVLLHRSRVAVSRYLLLPFFWGNLIWMLVMQNKLERYVHPLYPILCLGVAWWASTRAADRSRTLARGGVVAAFALVLALTAFWAPIPWLRWAPVDLHYLYELRMPSEEELARLRAQTYEVSCDLRPLVAAAETLAREDRSRRPITLVQVAGRDAPAPLDIHHMAMTGIAVADRVRHRYVGGPTLWTASELGPAARASPYLIVLHGPSVPVEAAPDARVLAQKRLELGCGPRRVEIMVTFLRQGGG